MNNIGLITHQENPNVGMDVDMKDEEKKEKIIAYVRNEEDKEKALSILQARGVDTELYEIIVDAEKYDETQAEHEKREEQRRLLKEYDIITRPYRDIMEHLYCDDGYGRMHTYTPTKTTIMKGLTQAKGRKHLSKKQRKKLNKTKH